MTERLIRDADRANLSDKSIINIINRHTGEQIATFFHDGSVDLPEIGKTLELEHAHLERSGEITGNELGLETLGEYEVIDISYKYTLGEWTNEEDDQVDQMFSVSTIVVEELNESRDE